MITEPAWNTAKAREQLAEMAFEGEKVPALYFGSAGVLSAYVSLRLAPCIAGAWRGLSSDLQVWSGRVRGKPVEGIAGSWSFDAGQKGMAEYRTDYTDSRLANRPHWSWMSGMPIRAVCLSLTGMLCVQVSLSTNSYVHETRCTRDCTRNPCSPLPH